MQNRDLTRGTLVTWERNPYVVVRPDSDRMVLIAHGDEVPARLGDALWVYSGQVTPRERSADATLELVVGVIRDRAARAKAIDGNLGDAYVTLVSLGFDLADKLHPEEGPERLAFIHRMFKDPTDNT